MQDFTAYDSETGQVIFSGVAHLPESLADQEKSVLVGARYEGGWLDGGGAHHQLPDQPSPAHVFNWATKQWEDPRTPETEWPLVRSRRNQLLTASDWTQLPDVPLATKESWAVYRQALRDITQQADPFNIVWPVPPA